MLKGMSKPTVGVFFGSRSAEHDVSIVTALAAIIVPLKLTRKYTVIPVYIAKDGQWFMDDKLGEIALYSSGKIDDYLKKAEPVKLIFQNGLVLQKGKRNRVRIDIAFPATHGTHGEDGELMAIFEMANVPYVGCGVSASAVAMDKVLAKQVSTSAGVPTPAWDWFTSADYVDNSKEILKRITSKLNYPLFVKPAHLGSSIGISKVGSLVELQNAIEVALVYDERIIVEQSVQNLYEVTLPIMGNQTLKPAFLEHPLTSDDEYFDFDKKYINGGKKGAGKSGKRGAQGYSELPAKLPDSLYKQAEKLGLSVYRALGCEGIARVDMLIDTKASKVYFNEVNTLPGSLYSHNWNKTGVSNIQLVEDLIDLAKQRWTSQQSKTTVFDTNFLKQF